MRERVTSDKVTAFTVWGRTDAPDDQYLMIMERIGVSLTSLLRSNQSWLMQFMRDYFPLVDSFAMSTRWEQWNLSSPPFVLEETEPWNLLALAEGYRLRYCFDPVPSDRLNADSGVNLNTIIYALSRHREGRAGSADLFEEYERVEFLWSHVVAPYVTTVVNQLQPHQGPLSPESERLLGQIAYLLAYWEVIRRHGILPDPISRARQSLDPLATLLASVPNPGLDHLQAVSQRLWSVRGYWPDTRWIQIHPELDRANIVGGARADLLWNHTMWDFDPSPTPVEDWRRALYRILVKVILADQHSDPMVEAAIYWTRWGTVERWPVDTLLRQTSGKHASRASWHERLLTSSRTHRGL